jgi:hypothetical protein
MQGSTHQGLRRKNQPFIKGLRRKSQPFINHFNDDATKTDGEQYIKTSKWWGNSDATREIRMSNMHQEFLTVFYCWFFLFSFFNCQRRSMQKFGYAWRKRHNDFEDGAEVDLRRTMLHKNWNIYFPPSWLQDYHFLRYISSIWKKCSL